MEDYQIVELYWNRNESAIEYTEKKYGKYCMTIAGNILFSQEDSAECVNDTYLQTWNSIPDNRPEKLNTYIGKICRNLAINMYEKITAAKRGGSQMESCLDELAEVVGNNDDMDENINYEMLTGSINVFLETLSKEARMIFVKRYWQMASVKDIAKEYNISESKVKMTLLRNREKLKALLLKEGYVV